MTSPLAAQSQQDAIRWAQHLRATLLQRARVDAAAFNAFVLKDEQTGSGVSLAPMHEVWHGLADRHDRLNIIAHVESAKTQNLSVGRVLQLMSRFNWVENKLKEVQ